MDLSRLLRAAVGLLTPRGASSSTAQPQRLRGPRPDAPSGRPAGREQRGGGQGRRGSGDTAAGAPSGGGRITEYDVAAFGAPVLSYSPTPDGDPDPGEVVWGWVPYEEDASQGKDRPLLVVGTGGGALVGVQLTSKDHSRDLARETARGRVWLDVGTGGWDSRGRESEARIDRVLRVDARAVRREGATLDRRVFDRVVAALRDQHDWLRW